jgi:hypothetical protein
MDLANAFCTAQAACCGGGTPDGGTGDGGASTGGCGAPAGAGVDGGPSSCVARATLSANQQLALVGTAFNEGLLTINPGVEGTCVAAYGQTSCSTLLAQSEPDVQAALTDPACAGLFTGYIPVGERCDMTYECQMGSFCESQGTGQNVMSISGSGTLGVCFPYVTANGACNTTDDCLPGLTCDPTNLTCG